MEIYIKTLSGAIQPIFFVEKEITISTVKKFTKKPGYDVFFFRHDSSEEYDSKNENPLGEDEKVFNGDVLNIFYKQEDFTDSDNIKFENMLKLRLGKFYENFKSFIIKHKAVIAGGSVLSVFGEYNMKDLDIYVHYSEAKEFISSLYVHGCQLLDINQAPAYDDSFFRKNNIMCRCYMKLKYRFYGNNMPPIQNINIDIMIIPDNIEIESVVTNFDLTFCEVWWDGIRIKSNNVADVKYKSGSLKEDYIPSYISMNSFTINRILKYKNRGFTINIDTTNIPSLGTFSINKKKKTIDSCADIWPEYIFFKYLLSRFPTNESIHSKMIFNYFKIYETFKSFKNLSQKEYLKDVYTSIVKCCYYSCVKDFLSQNYSKIYKNFFSEEMDTIINNISDYQQYESISDTWIRDTSSEISQEFRLLTRQRSEIEIMYRNI